MLLIKRATNLVEIYNSNNMEILEKQEVQEVQEVENIEVDPTPRRSK